jgi:hypothetical protein
MRTTLVLALLALLSAVSGCGDDDATPVGVGEVHVVNAGTGEPNAEPLWPLRVGTQFRFDAGTWFIGRDFDRGGKRTFILQTALRAGRVLPETLGAVDGEFGESETWLGETPAGLVLYATSPKHVLRYALLILPTTVRDGMQWTISGDGVVVAQASIEGGQEADTIYGRRRTWHLAVTRTTPDGRNLDVTFAEGRGVIATLSVLVSAAPVLSAIVPLEAGPAPAPLALTPMEPMYGGEPAIAAPGVSGGADLCAGSDLELRIGGDAYGDTWGWGAGGSYISAIENAEGKFDVRIGGVSLTCDRESLWWVRRGWVWGVETDGLDATPTAAPWTGYELPVPQDARTSAWNADRSRLFFTPVDPSGARQTGLFYEPPDNTGWDFVHSGSGTFIDSDGSPVSLSPDDGIAQIYETFPDTPRSSWYWPQQPTMPQRRTFAPLPIGSTPMILADADFIAHGGSTTYLVNDGGQLVSGRIEDGPGAYPEDHISLSGLRDGPLSADPLTTILRRDNTRETFLAQHHGGIWRLEYTEHGLTRTLLARPKVPAGQRIIGAFQSGDQVVVATDAGEIFNSIVIDGGIATGKVFLWHLPVVPGAAPEPFPSYLELNLAADGHDMRVEWSPEGDSPPLTGWTLAGEPVRAIPVPTLREVGDEPGLAIPRRALLLNRRNIPEVGPELWVPPPDYGPSPPPPPPIYPGRGEVGSYRAEGEIPGLGRVVFAGNVPHTELPAGPGYPDPPLLFTAPDASGATTPEPVFRDRRSGARWTVGALTTPTGTCPVAACLPVSVFVDAAPSTPAHPEPFLPTMFTWLVPTVSAASSLSIILAPPDGGVVVYDLYSGIQHRVTQDGTVAELRFPTPTATAQVVGGPSLDPAVPGSLSVCETLRDAAAHTVSVTCTTSDGRSRTSETLVEPTLNGGAGRGDEGNPWPGQDADQSIYAARTTRAYWACRDGSCPDGASLPEYQSHRLDLAEMRFRLHSGTVSYVRALDGELYAMSMLFAENFSTTAWRVFHVTARGLVLVAGGLAPIAPPYALGLMDFAVDDLFLKVKLDGEWFRIPLDEARAATGMCDFNALQSSAGCVCAPGFVGDGMTCTPAIGSLANPVRDCGAWYTAGQPPLGQHNPIVDDDGDGPRLPYASICAIEHDRLLVWPWAHEASSTLVKLDRDTWAPLECVAAFPLDSSPDFYSFAYGGAGTVAPELSGEFELTFTLSHNPSRAGVGVDVEDGFDPVTLAYTSYAQICSTSPWPRPDHVEVVGDSTYPEYQHAFRVIEGSAVGDVETDLPPAFQSALLGGAPMTLTRDAAGMFTLRAGAESYGLARPHPGVMHVFGEGRQQLSSGYAPYPGLARISLPAP